MANMLENYGLGFFSEDEDTMRNFVGYLIQNGKALHSYTGIPYLFTPMGAVEFWTRLEKNEDGGSAFAGFDSHCGGQCVWKLSATEIDLSKSLDEPGKRLMIFNNAGDGSGVVPIEVINPEVLPGLLDGDEVEMQIVGLPIHIDYFADETEYEASQPEDKDGKKWMVANGTLFPSGFMYNHALNRLEEEKDESIEAHIVFNGTVKRLIYGTFDLDGKSENTFVRCFIDTSFGELELDHTVEQVQEEMRKNMRVGAVVSGVCILSGDVALHEYENGIIKDLEHNLMALRYSFVQGKAERLFPILCENAVFYTATSDRTFEGATAIVDRLNYVNDHRKGDYRAFMATITEVDSEELKYPVGTRCLALSVDKGESFESIVFIICNNQGLVEKIDLCTDGRYHFKIDERPVLKSFLEDDSNTDM